MRRLASNLRGRLTYANVVASLALFLALGGTSYAALTVTGRNVRNGSLTGADIKDGSLGRADLRAGTATPGPRGADGAEGPRGPQGLSGADGQRGQTGPSDAYHLQVGSFDSTDSRSLTLPAGKYAIVGHVALFNAGSATQQVPCNLLSMQDADGTHRDAATPAVAVSSEEEVTMTAVLDLPEGGAASLSCGLQPGLTTGRWSIVATKVGALHG